MTSETMKAVVLHGKERVVLENVYIGEPANGEVRIKIERALTCGTDVKVYRRGEHARMIRPPALFGHEFAGIVDAVGTGVSHWKVGDRVVVANSAPCDECYYCSIGREELCENLLFFNGAFAEKAIVPSRIVSKNMLAVDAGTPLESAAMCEPLACVVRGLEVAPVAAGQSVVVLGLGPIGLMFVRMCVIAGCTVIAVGRREARLRLAYEFGAVDTINVDECIDIVERVRSQTPCGRGADTVIEAIGSPAAWSDAISIVRKGGMVNLFGGCASGTTISIDTSRLHYDEVTLRSSFHHTPRSFQKALQLLSSLEVDAQRFITTRITLNEIPDTLARLAAGQLDIVKASVLM